MKITKLGHCCLLIEDQGVKILTDPGIFTVEAHAKLENLDAVVITHEHADHFHLESLKLLLQKNPQVKIYTNASVGALLASAGVDFVLVGDGQQASIGNILLEGFGSKHEEIYQDYGQVENTSYFIGPKLFYPGDAFYVPNRQVEILALPVAGPWVNLLGSINYAKKIKPQVAFPVHDGILKSAGVFHQVPKKILSDYQINFIPLWENGELEL